MKRTGDGQKDRNGNEKQRGTRGGDRRMREGRMEGRAAEEEQERRSTEGRTEWRTNGREEHGRKIRRKSGDCNANMEERTVNRKSRVVRT